MKRLINDIKKYYRYLIYASASELKSEVANSYLGWIWWILEPTLFMFVYIFVSFVVFRNKEQHFPIFVFVGLSSWQFFDKTLKQSVKLVSANKSVVSKIYLPKFILILIRIAVNGFKMFISYGLIVLMLFVFRVPISLNILFVVPLVITLMLFTFGLSCLMLHFGVFVEDLSNVLYIFLKFVFYLTGIFFSVEKRVPKPWNAFLLKLNPVAFIIDSLRKSIIYAESIDVFGLFVWFFVSLIISSMGLLLIYKYENTYVKVI